MLNFYYGLIAVLRGGSVSFQGVLEYEFIWGLLLGFFLATVVQAFVNTKYPQKLIPLIFSNDIAMSYSNVVTPDQQGVYKNMSFSHFTKMIYRLKLTFLLSVCILAFFLFLVTWNF